MINNDRLINFYFTTQHRENYFLCEIKTLIFYVQSKILTTGVGRTLTVDFNSPKDSFMIYGLYTSSIKLEIIESNECNDIDPLGRVNIVSSQIWRTISSTPAKHSFSVAIAITPNRAGKAKDSGNVSQSQLVPVSLSVIKITYYEEKN